MKAFERKPTAIKRELCLNHGILLPNTGQNVYYFHADRRCVFIFRSSLSKILVFVTIKLLPGFGCQMFIKIWKFHKNYLYKTSWYRLSFIGYSWFEQRSSSTWWNLLAWEHWDQVSKTVATASGSQNALGSATKFQQVCKKYHFLITQKSKSPNSSRFQLT